MTDTIGKRIRSLRAEAGISMDKLAEKIGSNSSTITYWENDKRLPGAEYVITLAKYFNVSTDWILTGLEGKSFKDKKSDIFFNEERVSTTQNDELIGLVGKIHELPKDKIMLLDAMVVEFLKASKYEKLEVREEKQSPTTIREESAAKLYDFPHQEEFLEENIWLSYIGAASAGPGNTYYEFIRGYIPVPASVAKGTCFVIEIKGESMSGDGIHDGDLVVIRQQRTVESSEIALVRVKDEFLLKRVKIVDNIAILVSSNPDTPNKEVMANELQIVGIFVYLIPAEFGLANLSDEPY